MIRLLTFLALVLVLLLPAGPAGAEQPGAPVLTAPAPGARLTGMEATLAWDLPPGTTQVHLQVTPANNDGPGVNLIRNASGSFRLPPPPEWYGLLPDVTYTWRARASVATTAVGESDASWGPWSDQRTFRTPTASAATVSAVEPSDTALVQNQTPLLGWEDANPTTWYYEIQISRDPAFGQSAPLYWEIVHGYKASLHRQYSVPDRYPLEAGLTYYWRVRPRVQGDGTPVGWSQVFRFTTPAHRRVTLDDSGKTVTLRVGDTLEVNLGEDFRWSLTVETPGILEPLPTAGIRAMPAMFRAERTGSTRLAATGNLPCHDAQPPCMAPSRYWEVRIEVRARLVREPAPIDAATVRKVGGRYVAEVVSGLPNGCVEFDGFTAVRSSDSAVDIRVYNMVPTDRATACTMIYGIVESSIPLPGEFVAGRVYTVRINDRTVTFTAG